MTPCVFTFDDSAPFNGFAEGTTWNGFDNVSVTLATAHEIDRWFATEAALHGYDPSGLEVIADMPAKDGLISLGFGFATQIIE